MKKRVFLALLATAAAAVLVVRPGWQDEIRLTTSATEGTVAPVPVAEDPTESEPAQVSVSGPETVTVPTTRPAMARPADDAPAASPPSTDPAPAPLEVEPTPVVELEPETPTTTAPPAVEEPVAQPTSTTSTTFLPYQDGRGGLTR